MDLMWLVNNQHDNYNRYLESTKNEKHQAG